MNSTALVQPRTLRLRRLDDLGAEPLFSHPLGQKEAIYEQEAHSGAPGQAAADRPLSGSETRTASSRWSR